MGRHPGSTVRVAGNKGMAGTAAMRVCSTQAEKTQQEKDNHNQPDNVDNLVHSLSTVRQRIGFRPR